MVADGGGVLNGHAVVALAPPTDKKLVIRDKLSLIVELIWISLLLVPCILLSVFKKIFPPSGKSLRDQVVIVTGAGRGLGKGLALGLAKEGCKVAVADINRVNAEQTAAEIMEAGGVAKAYFTNVAIVEEVRELHMSVRKDLGPVDILVNNAGLIHGEPLEDYTDESIKAVLSVNLMSHFWMAREFLPEMKKRNLGHIVAIASLASLTSLPSAAAYVASKFGVRGFMEVVRGELEMIKHNRVKTTTVYPYFINTSALYVDHWLLRIPPLSIEETVKTTIASIKREEVSVSVPGHMYSAIHLCRLLPQYIEDQYNRVFYAKILPITEEEKAVSPITAIIQDLAKHDVAAS